MDNNKTSTQIIEDWNVFKTTPKGKIFVVSYFPFHMLREFFLHLANLCSNDWIMRAAKARTNEANEALKKRIKIEKKNNALVKENQGIIEQIKQLKILIKEDKKYEALKLCDEVMGIKL